MILRDLPFKKRTQGNRKLIWRDTWEKALSWVTGSSYLRQKYLFRIDYSNWTLSYATGLHVFMKNWSFLFLLSFSCYLFVHRNDLSTGRYILGISNTEKRKCSGLGWKILSFSLFCSFLLLTRFFRYHWAVATRYDDLDETHCDLRCDRCNYAGTVIMLARQYPHYVEALRSLLCRVFVVNLFFTCVNDAGEHHNLNCIHSFIGNAKSYAPSRHKILH